MSANTHQLLQRSLLGEAIDLLEDVAVFVWNEERNYVAVNEHACQLVGVSREELVGMRVGTLTLDPEEALAETRASRHATGQLTFTRRDGEAVNLEWTTIRTRVAGLPYMVSICRRVASTI